MIEIEEAERILREKAGYFHHTRLGGTRSAAIEEITVSHQAAPGRTAKLQYQGRILAEDIYSDIDVPKFASSAMDGYVFYRKDLAGNQRFSAPIPLWRRDAAVGQVPGVLPPGFCCKIYTGAPLPHSECKEGALLVVPQENCELREGPDSAEATAGTQAVCAAIPEAAVFPDHVRPQGQNYRRGDLVVAKGALCTPELLSVLAAAGRSRLKVYRPLSLALCISGDELVSAGSDLPSLELGQIYDSNSIYLAYQCSQLGWDTTLVHLRDDYGETQAQLHKLARDFDAVLCSGGASVGDRDYIQQVIVEDSEVYIRKIAIKPGKPFTFAKLGDTPIFCLPGNPLAVYIGFLYFVLPFLRQLQGQENVAVRKRKVAAPCEIQMAPRAQFVFGRSHDPSGKIIEVLGEQSSSLLKYQYLADGALLVPPSKNRQLVHKGEELDWVPFRAQLL